MSLTTHSTSQIPSLSIYTPNDLEQHINTITEHLKDITTHEWDIRVKAMKTLCTIVQQQCHLFDNFIPLLYKCKDGLALQVTDLRSSVTREACNCIITLSSSLREQFEPFIETMLIQLFKLVCVTIQVMSHSGSECIRKLVENGIGRGIGKISKLQQNKRKQHTV